MLSMLSLAAQLEMGLAKWAAACVLAHPVGMFAGHEPISC